MTGGNCLGFAVSWKNGRLAPAGGPQSVPTTDAQLSRTQSQSAAGRAWSWRRDSNPRPSDYKSDALPLSYASPARLPAGLTNLKKYQNGRQIARGPGTFLFPPAPRLPFLLAAAPAWPILPRFDSLRGGSGCPAESKPCSCWGRWRL